MNATSKVSWRLLPLLFVCYVIAYIDRINIGFAKLQLREALGVDPASFDAVYGLGAGLFFVGYFLFEIPSNLILEKVGARIWIARIMVLWGLVSMGMVFMRSAGAFYFMRFLLGAAEAGFFPGVLLYLTAWYPTRERARTFALFAIGGVTAGVVGSPISGAILELNGFGGLAGWQWLCILEGLPAVVLGIVVLTLLPNRPREARWLTDAEKTWVEERVAADVATMGTRHAHNLSQVFRSPLVWLLCATYFALNIGTYGFELWLPSIIKSFDVKNNAVVGCLNAIPYLAAAAVMFIVGRSSDRTAERRWHVALAALASAAGFGLSAYFHQPVLGLAALALAFAGIKSTIGPFWALATTFLSGTAAAGGIALINSVGSLGGFVGPYLVGLIVQKTHSNFAALLFLGSSLLAMSILILIVRPAKPHAEVSANESRE